MEKQLDLKRLRDFFSPDDIEWKPITISKKTDKGLAAAYITVRAIMDRLDEVCGPENWRNEFKPGPDGGVLCGLSIRVDGEWITKWDGAENTDIEAVKGGLSSAMRRAAVQWGIGRYLYDLPQQWVPVDERGRFRQPPSIPAMFLPPATGDSAPTAEAPVPTPQPPAQRRLVPRQHGGGTRPQRPAPPANRPPQDAQDDYFPQDLPF